MRRTRPTLVRLLEHGCERFALCHISQENNTPELALESVRAALLGAGVVPGRDCVVNAARRHEVSPIIEFYGAVRQPQDNRREALCRPLRSSRWGS